MCTEVFNILYSTHIAILHHSLPKGSLSDVGFDWNSCNSCIKANQGMGFVFDKET